MLSYGFLIFEARNYLWVESPLIILIRCVFQIHFVRSSNSIGSLWFLFLLLVFMAYNKLHNYSDRPAGSPV